MKSLDDLVCEDIRITFLNLILEVEQTIGENLEFTFSSSKDSIKGKITIPADVYHEYEEVFPNLPIDLVRYTGAKVICSDPDHPSNFIFQPAKERKDDFSIEFIIQAKD